MRTFVVSSLLSTVTRDWLVVQRPLVKLVESHYCLRRLLINIAQNLSARCWHILVAVVYIFFCKFLMGSILSCFFHLRMVLVRLRCSHDECSHWYSISSCHTGIDRGERNNYTCVSDITLRSVALIRKWASDRRGLLKRSVEITTNLEPRFPFQQYFLDLQNYYVFDFLL